MHQVHKTAGCCGSEKHDQEFMLTEISHECCLLDVNFTVGSFLKILDLREVDRKDHHRSWNNINS